MTFRGTLASLLLFAGCGASGAPVERAPCVTDGGVLTLWTASQWIGGTAAIDGGVLVGSFSGIEQVPFSGSPASLTTFSAGDGLLVGAGQVFFTTDDPPVGESAGLFEMPLSGGTPIAVSGAPSSQAGGPQCTDGEQLFLSDYDSIEVFTPGGGSSKISLGALYQMITMAVSEGWIYVAAVDPTVAPESLSNGVILRVPSGGGSAQKLLVGIGHPSALAVGVAGLFWSEASTSQPFYSGIGSIRGARLDGSSPSTLLPIGATSLALSGNTLLYGGADGTVGAIHSDGSVPVTLASGLSAPQVIASGGNAVWFSPGGGEPLSGGPSQVLQTTCIPQ